MLNKEFIRPETLSLESMVENSFKKKLIAILSKLQPEGQNLYEIARNALHNLQDPCRKQKVFSIPNSSSRQGNLDMTLALTLEAAIKMTRDFIARGKAYVIEEGDDPIVKPVNQERRTARNFKIRTGSKD